MKLASFTVNGMPRFGAVMEGGVIDLKSKFKKYPDLKSFLKSEEIADADLHASEIDYTLDQIRFLPVIPNPSKILCVGLNYYEHVREVGREKTDAPVIFSRVADSQIGHLDYLILPPESNMFDFEGEIAVVIGKTGRRIPEDDAYDYIAGYACYNDGSIRDWQLQNDQWIPGKNFNGTGAFGPCLVTRDEIKDDEVLTLETRVNGEVMQQSTTDLLIFPIPKLIAFISTFTTLRPGDVIVTGTPGGVGFKREPQRFLKEGDIVEIEVSKIGTLRNVVKAEKLL